MAFICGFFGLQLHICNRIQVESLSLGGLSIEFLSIQSSLLKCHWFYLCLARPSLGLQNDPFMFCFYPASIFLVTAMGDNDFLVPLND